MTALAYKCPYCGSDDLETLGALRRIVYRCRRCGRTFQS